MSIASRITAMEGHISNAYDGLEDLGVDLTNVDKNIDNIASKLEEVWQGYPKVSESDETEATLNGTKKGRMKLDLKGNTEQTQLTGKNLFDISKVLSNWNDTTNIGIKNNNDNTLTISTPNTSSSVLALSPNKLSDYCPELEVGDIVYLNAETTGTQKFIYLSASSTSWAFGTQRTITQNDLDSNVYWYSSGVSTQATISNIMIRNNGTTADFEPYCGGIPSPSPQFPQQIKNVTGNVNVKVQNKNLAWNGWAQDFVTRINDSNLASLTTKNGKSCLKFDRTAGYGSYNTKYLFKTNWKENTQYTISCDLFAEGSNAFANIGIEYTDGTTDDNRYNRTVDNWKKYFILSAENKTIKYLRVQWLAGINYIDLDTFMVEENISATDYVPHQEQNYPFSLKSKNLFDIENLNFNNGYYDNNGNFISNNNNGAFDFIKVKPNTNYIFSLSSNVYNITIVEFNNSKTFIKRNQISNVDKNEVLLDNNTNYIKITINLNNAPTVTKKKVKALNPQLEQGSTATDYEPYYDIKAMQGTKLKDDGIHNKKKQKVLDGTEAYNLTRTGSSYCFWFRNNTIPDCLQKMHEKVCNYFNYSSAFYLTAPTPSLCENDNDTPGGHMFIFKTDGTQGTTVAQWKSWLAEQYANNNPVIIEYELEEEEIIPYQGTQQAQYNAIRKAQSYDDQTNISQTNDELPFVLDIEALKNN